LYQFNTGFVPRESDIPKKQSRLRPTMTVSRNLQEGRVD
jgi:hypothetical protein